VANFATSSVFIRVLTSFPDYTDALGAAYMTVGLFVMVVRIVKIFDTEVLNVLTGDV